MKIKFLYFGNSSGGVDDRNGAGDDGCDGDSDLMTVIRMVVALL
jgi:hypothetical protein